MNLRRSRLTACVLLSISMVSGLAAAEAPVQVGVSQLAGRHAASPKRGAVVLQTGDNLWNVAKRNGVSADALARANGIKLTATLQPGTRLSLPGKFKDAPPGKNASKGGDSKAKTISTRNELPPRSTVRSGSVSFFRVATGERLRLVVTDQQGRVRPQAAGRMASFLRPRGSKKQKRPDMRLLGHLAEVSKHYEGRTIQVMSGYRVAKGFTSKESRHTKGAAMDIHIDGVSNRALCDYLRHFKNTGVGFYPHSLFVHFDVRDKNAYWIDMSSPGGKPSYLDGEQREHFDGKNKDQGLVELGKAVADVVGGTDDYESDSEGEGE